MLRDNEENEGGGGGENAASNVNDGDDRDGSEEERRRRHCCRTGQQFRGGGESVGGGGDDGDQGDVRPRGAHSSGSSQFLKVPRRTSKSVRFREDGGGGSDLARRYTCGHSLCHELKT